MTTYKLNDFLKIAIFKKGNRDRKSKNYANKLAIKKLDKQDGTQLLLYIEQKADSKVFAIHILTARL